MQRLATFPVLALLALAPTGCLYDTASMPVLTTHGVPSDIREVRPVATRHAVRGRDTAVTSVLFFPTGLQPSLAAAVDDAIARGEGDGLVRAQVQTRNAWFGIGLSSLLVEGDVVVLEEPEAQGAEFAALSTRRRPRHRGAYDPDYRVDGVEGRRSVHQILWISTEPSPPRLGDAVEDALKEGGGDLLINATVEYDSFTIPLIYGVERWIVRGDVVRMRPAESPH